MDGPHKRLIYTHHIGALFLAMTHEDAPLLAADQTPLMLRAIC